MAVKVINKENMSQKEMQFMREEIQIMKMIWHPRIVEMKQVYEDTSKIYIIMEQVNGGDMQDQISQTLITERFGAKIIF